MARVNVRGQNFEVPDQVGGADLNQLINPAADEVPVRIRPDGRYEPLKDHDEYTIDDESRFDTIHRLRNGRSGECFCTPGNYFEF